MPNWCIGALKVRGEKENILRFLKEGIVPMGYIGDTGEVQIDEGKYSITLKTDEHGYYIKGAGRCFIQESEIKWYYGSVLVLNVECAWEVDVGGLTEMSKEYDLDFKIYAFERGMQFNQDVEIHKGVVIKDEEITFNDYEWECINPTLGG